MSFDYKWWCFCKLYNPQRLVLKMVFKCSSGPLFHRHCRRQNQPKCNQLKLEKLFAQSWKYMLCLLKRGNSSNRANAFCQIERKKPLLFVPRSQFQHECSTQHSTAAQRNGREYFFPRVGCKSKRKELFVVIWISIEKKRAKKNTPLLILMSVERKTSWTFNVVLYELHAYVNVCVAYSFWTRLHKGV